MSCLGAKVSSLMRHLRQPLAVMAAISMIGTAASAWATTKSVTWTTKGDFESGKPLVNIDTSTVPGDVMIGPPKDLLSTAAISCSAGNKIYSIGAERASLAVLSAASNQLLRVIPLPARSFGLVYNSTNDKIYIGNEAGVVVVDVGTDTIVKTVAMGDGPYPMAYNPDQNKVYVASMAGRSVTVLDGASDTITGSPVPVLIGPHAASYRAGKLYVTNKYNNSVSVIDGVTDTVDATILVEPVRGTIGSPVPESWGLVAAASAHGITTADRMFLEWKHEPLKTDENIEFQIRTSPTGQYVGPNGTADTWYDQLSPGAEPTQTGDGTRVPLPFGFAPHLDIMVRLSSDATGSPVLHEVSLLYETYPELAVTAIDAPDKVGPGKPFSVSTTVANEGSEDAGPFLVGHRLYDGTVNRVLACDRAISFLGAKTSDTGSATCTMPADLKAGTYTLEACADYTNAVVEGVETNNCLTRLIQVIQPDLVVSAVNGPPTAKIGKNVDINVTVSNAGDDDAGTFAVRVGVVKVVNEVKEEHWFDCDKSVAALASTASAELAVICQVTPNLLPGLYNYIAYADFNHAVAESNEENNSKVGNEGDWYPPLPDLAMTAVSGPATGTIGSAISVSSTVANLADDCTASFDVKVYLVPLDSQSYYQNPANPFRGDEVLLCGRTVASLAAANSDTAGTNCTIATGTPTGDYYLLAVADQANAIPETSESNNRILSALPIYVPSQEADLVPIDMTITGEIATGAQITITVTVKNRGLTSTGYFDVKPCYTTDSTFATCTPIIHSGPVSLGAGLSRDLIYGMTVPDIAAGTYYIGIDVDPANAVPEYTKINNKALAERVVVYGPDLVGTAMTVPTTAVTGQSVTIPVTVKNQGIGMTQKNFANSLYYSTDPQFTTKTLLSSGGSPITLGSGLQRDLSFTASIPAAMVTGNYYIGFLPDSGLIINESDEVNNMLVRGPIAVTGGPDLVVTTITTPATATSGQWVNVPFKVKNQGTHSTVQGFTVSLYYSTDPQFATMTKLKDTTTTNLGSGLERSLYFYVQFPSVPPGTYYLAAIADSASVVPESDENNNMKVGTPTVRP